jgi:putative two-component system response regulator
MITDLDLSDGSGLDLVVHASGEHQDVACIVISTTDDPALAQAAFRNGAHWFLVKPLRDSDLAIAISGALDRRERDVDRRSQLERLEGMVRTRSGDMWNYVYRLEQAEREMRLLQEETITRLSLAAEFRDDETPRHIERMSRYCALLADRLGEDPDRCELIRVASALHDVGKIAIPDSILLKPGPLDETEWVIMRRHCELGHRILSGSKTDLLSIAATIALTHHERVDGGGYPYGLAGDEIPIVGRIAAVADVFDSLTSDKVYRKALSLKKAFEIMEEGRGTQFDADVLDLFMAERARVLGIKERFADLRPDEVDIDPLSALVTEP